MIELSKKKLDKYLKIVSANSDKYSEAECDKIIDPDLNITEMIGGYKFAPDGICGHKYLEKYWNGDAEIDEAYKVIRSKVILWPKHKESINVKRYRKYRDRIDFTIFDLLSYFYDGSSSLIEPGTSTETIFEYLKPEDFITEFGLETFVEWDEDKKRYRVFNLSENDNSFIDNISEYSFNQKTNQTYLKNLYNRLKPSNDK